MSKVGYIRVSSTDQNVDRQVELLESKYGVERLYIDKASGKDTNRPELQRMMEWIREGDIVHIVSISRLARNTRDFLELMDIFNREGIGVVCDKEPIDTTTPQGKMIATIFASMYEMERENIRQRQAEGIAIAKAQGRHLGRPKAEYPDKWEEVYVKYKNKEITGVKAMELLGLKKTTFYKLKKEWEYKDA